MHPQAAGETEAWGEASPPLSPSTYLSVEWQLELGSVQRKKIAEGGTKAWGALPVPSQKVPHTHTPSSRLRAAAHITLASPGTNRTHLLSHTLDRCYKCVPAWTWGTWRFPNKRLGGRWENMEVLGMSSQDGEAWEAPYWIG